MEAGAKFADPIFIPHDRSIYLGSDATGERINGVSWKRPDEFFDGEYRLFEDQIEPGDIKQG
jgi:hypothetical protein